MFGVLSCRHSNQHMLAQSCLILIKVTMQPRDNWWDGWKGGGVTGVGGGVEVGR